MILFSRQKKSIFGSFLKTFISNRKFDWIFFFIFEIVKTLCFCTSENILENIRLGSGGCLLDHNVLWLLEKFSANSTLTYQILKHYFSPFKLTVLLLFFFIWWTPSNVMEHDEFRRVLIELVRAAIKILRYMTLMTIMGMIKARLTMTKVRIQL